MPKRNTLQRQMVLQALNTLHTHATAEEVYAEVAKDYENISLATVYRNLNSLAEQGLCKKIAVPGGADRYDFSVHRHYHMLCRGCGRFEDSHLPYQSGLAERAGELSGYRMEGYDIVFTGLCPDCQARRGETYKR